MVTRAPASQPFTKFPGDGLRDIKRLVTGYDDTGKSVFLKEDNGDHQGLMLDGLAVQNCIYSTGPVPVNINDRKDIKFDAENKPGVIAENGTLARMIDFTPGLSSELHRSIALVYGVVIEGEFEVELGGGEKRQMLPGDMIVNRSAVHKWTNTSQTKPGRMLFVLLDVEPVIVNGEKIGFDLGELQNEYD